MVEDDRATKSPGRVGQIRPPVLVERLAVDLGPADAQQTRLQADPVSPALSPFL